MKFTVEMSAVDLHDEDVSAVARVLRSGRLALGPHAEQLGDNVARRCRVKYGIAVSSGTAALHILVRALGIAPGDEVLMPSFAFAASVNVLLYERARPIFVDIEPETYNMSVADLVSKITTRTKAIMAVDTFGHPACWDEIEAVARRRGLLVIDDACEALGSEYKGRRIGGFGDAAAFSFYPNKQITTGEGGVIVTANEDIATMARSLRNQGRDRMGARVEHERLGYNYRMDEMSAALGLSQLTRLDEMVERRAQIARMYTERLRKIPWLKPPTVRPEVRMSWFTYVVRLAEGMDRGRFMDAVEAKAIPVRGYFAPLHLVPYVRERLMDVVALPVTESIATRTVALPFHARLTEQQIDHIIRVLTSVGGRQA